MDETNQLLISFFKNHHSNESFSLSNEAKTFVSQWVIEMEKGEFTYLALESKLGLLADKSVCSELERFILAGYSYRPSSIQNE